MKLALIQISNSEVLNIFYGGPEIAIRYTLPDGKQVSPIVSGWSNSKYSILPVTELEIPEGKQPASPPTYTYDNGNVIEEYELEGIPVIIPDRITSRQFKFQLIEMGLYETVLSWVNHQDLKTRVGFETSSTFVRTDGVLNKGFIDLGFTKEQVDDFFLKASQI